MCLAVPMQLIEITGEGTGKVNAGRRQDRRQPDDDPSCQVGRLSHCACRLRNRGYWTMRRLESDSISSESSRRPPQARRSREFH